MEVGNFLMSNIPLAQMRGTVWEVSEQDLDHALRHSELQGGLRVNCMAKGRSKAYGSSARLPEEQDLQ